MTMTSLLPEKLDFHSDIDLLTLGVWRPIFWSPFPQAEEKILIAVALTFGENKKVLQAIDTIALKAMYQSRFLNAEKIINVVLNTLDKILFNESLTSDNLIPFENFSLGKTYEIAAKNIDDAMCQIVTMHSSFMTSSRYLDMRNKLSVDKQINEWKNNIKEAYIQSYGSFGIEFNKKIQIDHKYIHYDFVEEEQKAGSQFVTLNKKNHLPYVQQKAAELLILKNKGFNRQLLLIKKEPNTEELHQELLWQTNKTGWRMPPSVIIDSIADGVGHLHKLLATS